MLRVPPHSVEAEQSVLGALLMDAPALGKISQIVGAQDFYRHEHKLIFGAIAALSTAGQPFDLITVFERLRDAQTDFGGLPYLNEIAQCVPGSANIVRYAEIVAERATLRAIIAQADEMATRAFRADAPPDVLLDDAKVALGRIGQHRALTRRGVPLLPLERLAEVAQGVHWVVKHVIPADSIGVIFGGSGTFKSFIGLDMALHVAHGLPWMGRRTTQGPVIYIAAEGGAGLWARVRAWHIDRRLDWRKTPLFVVPVAVDLGADAWRVVDAAQASGVLPSAVIVDTMSQTFSGEENSATEVAGYLRELGRRFRELWHCAVAVVHHSGHQATERPRGSTVIRTNVDFMLGVFRDEKEMLATVTCVKQKDGELFEDATFSLRSLEVGRDEDGDAITSLVARHLSTAEDVGEAMEAESKAGRGGKNQLLLSLLQSGQKESELRKVFCDECGADGAEARRQAWSRASRWAKARGFFEVAQGYVIVTKPKG